MRGVATVWNDTIGAFHIEIPSWVPVIGGDSFSMPKMSVPSLQAGGIITQTGLIYAHAGEAISPMPAGGMGPAVVIQDAHFSDAVDVDLFMNRVAWATRTKRL